jgi:O-antigen ligase
VVVVANAVALPVLGAEAWQVPLDDKGLPLKDPNGEMVQRFTGFMGNANALGLLMLVTVSCALVSLPYTSGRSRTTLLITSVAAIALAALADSRSSFAALGIGVLLFFLFRYRSRALAAAGILFLFAMAALPLFGPALADYVTRGDVATLTGRTDVWEFVLREIHARPLVGYGYETAGQIFMSRYFPVWTGPWDLGPQSSLHNGYLNRAIGMGIPATLFWLFIVLRPWFSLARQDEDTFDLKPVLTLLVIPLLITNLTETAISDFAEMSGLLFGIAWAAAEMQRIRWLEKRAKSIVERQRGEAPAVAALRSLSRA